MKDYIHGFASFDINVFGVDAFRIGTNKVIQVMNDLFKQMEQGSLVNETTNIIQQH